MSFNTSSCSLRVASPGSFCFSRSSADWAFLAMRSRIFSGSSSGAVSSGSIGTRRCKMMSPASNASLWYMIVTPVSR